jgi:hypothetical protein
MVAVLLLTSYNSATKHLCGLLHHLARSLSAEVFGHITLPIQCQVAFLLSPIKKS